MTRWEYRQEYIQLKRKALDTEAIQGLTEYYNKFGQDGWELVTYIPDMRDAGMLVGTKPQGIIATFKRPIPG
ncbi:MAG: DUF4177 domain-containing protein [Candidatus Hydrogenedentes bacterium]|nr:DUF4177 domain-containing protein [Candidatus Hydrogenedentota bacterium]